MRSRSTTRSSLGEHSMLADAEVLEHAGDQRFVSMASERHAVQQHPTTGKHAARDRYRQRVERYDIDGIGTEVLGHGVSNRQSYLESICSIRDIDRNIDVAMPRTASRRCASKQIGEVDIRSRRRNDLTQAGQTAFDVYRKRFVD